MLNSNLRRNEDSILKGVKKLLLFQIDIFFTTYVLKLDWSVLHIFYLPPIFLYH